MNARWTASHGVTWGGLAIGPLCWALNTQLSYSLVPWACHRGWNPFPAVAGLFAVISLAGAILSWIAWRRHGHRESHFPEKDGHSRYLLAGVGVGTGLLFALATAMQGAAALFLAPCLR